MTMVVDVIYGFPLGVGVGRNNNKCHLDCAGRGLCDHSTGICKCFKGSTGANCASLVGEYIHIEDSTFLVGAYH